MVQYAYDIMDRVTNISWRTSNGATLGGFAYEYDAVGRITSRSHTLGDPSQPSSPMSQSSQKSYTYDDFDRLASDLVPQARERLWIDAVIAVRSGIRDSLDCR